MGYVYTTEYYSATKNKDIVHFADKWMEHENIILSETGGSTYQLTQTDGDTHSKQWMELGESYGRTGGRIVASKGIGNLQEDQQTQLTQTLGAR